MDSTASTGTDGCVAQGTGARLPPGSRMARGEPHAAGARLARLAVRDISFQYGERQVLRRVSFEVAAGEIVGLLGPNGTGKSTLFSILTGLLRPAAGAILLDGREIAPGARALRARMGVVFQAPAMFPMSADHPALAAVMRANPVAYAVSAARRALQGELAPGALPGTSGRDLAVVAVFAASALALAILASRRRP